MLHWRADAADEGGEAQLAPGSSQASASPEPERWGTPISDLTASPAGGAALHAPPAAQAAVRSLESSLGAAGRGMPAHIAAAASFPALELLADANGTALSDNCTAVPETGGEAADAATAVPETASGAAAGTAFLSDSTLRVSVAVAVQLEASDSTAAVSSVLVCEAAHQQDATVAHAMNAPQPDEVHRHSAPSSVASVPSHMFLSCAKGSLRQSPAAMRELTTPPGTVPYPMLPDPQHIP